MSPPASLDIVEELAQRIHYYTMIVEWQKDEGQRSPSLYQAACGHVAQSSFVGRDWFPSPEDYDAYMNHMDNICKIQPESADECVLSYIIYSALL
jgi:hypothetical protein